MTRRLNKNSIRSENHLRTLCQLYKTKAGEVVGPFRSKEDSSTNDQEACMTLNEYFLSVLTQEDASSFSEHVHLFTGGEDKKNYVKSIKLKKRSKRRGQGSDSTFI